MTLRKLLWVLPLSFCLHSYSSCNAFAGCDDPNVVIDWSDQSVVRGDGLFQRETDNYPFETYTVAAKDPSDTHNICFRYKIKNVTAFSGSNSGLSKPIKSFRWKDIDLQFVDIDNYFDWDKTDFTNYSELQVVTSAVGAFEKSPSTTTTILTTEEAEAARKPGVRPIGRYDVKDHFPTIGAALSGAHLPATPVIPVPNDAAKGIQPIINTINTQDLHATIVSKNSFDGSKNFLTTIVDLHGLNSDDASLFIPTLPEGESGGVASLRSDDDLSNYVAQVRLRGEKPEKKAFDKAGFLTKTTLGSPSEDHKTDSQPAFFIVRYPVTIKTKSNNLCVIIYGLSPYPINADETYCQK